MGSTNRDTIWYNEASVRQMDRMLNVFSTDPMMLA